MKKILASLLLIAFIPSLTSPVAAIALRPWTETQENVAKEIEYPAWEDFVKLRQLIESSFSKWTQKDRYNSNCIADASLCANYKYTSVVEKAIKLILAKTYIWNEPFYRSVFAPNYSQGFGSSWWTPSYPKLVNMLNAVPKWTAIFDWKTFSFGSSIGWELLDASFGINFTENANSSTMLTAIESKIKELKQTKCRNQNPGSNGYTTCYSENISNRYLPTPEELYKEAIYVNRSMVKIEDLKDEFDYTISWSLSQADWKLADRFPYKSTVDTYTDNLINEKLWQISTDDDSSTENASLEYMELIEKIRENPRLQDIASAKLVLDKASQNSTLSSEERNLISWLKEEMKFYEDELNKMDSGITYELKYKKTTYTLEEARQEIDKKAVTTGTVYSFRNRGSTLPCSSSSNFATRTECTAAMALMKDLMNVLWAYYSDKEAYPDSIDLLNSSYIENQSMLVEFKKNFTYKNTSSDFSPDYEIRYIGKIGEWVSDSPAKKDYLALMSGATVPEIPGIFLFIPSDSMVLYVRNPANLIDILNQKSNTSKRLSGLDVSESIKRFMLTFFELESFDQIEDNLKHEMVIVVNNLDATAPDIVLILSEADRDALSPTAKARVVGSKDGFIFIANSKETLERFTSLTPDKSLRDAPDFQYVWWKKSALIEDALIFVWDAFFEKMLTLESYITHYRKYRDYRNLSSMQELVWAYGDAFWKMPATLNDFTTLGLTTLTPTTLNQYSLADGIVTHKNIGTLRSTKTLPEAGYDLAQISRAEIEDYKFNVQGYRDIWTSSLDPMGIVINRYGDGLEMDFFMTPIPESTKNTLTNFLYAFQWGAADPASRKDFSDLLKDSLSFITNPQIRMWLLSFVVGYDAKKVQTVIMDNKNLNSLYQEFNKEVLDGKDIFDYIGGEFAFSVGDLDPDMLDGWNIDKVDLYLSVQVTDEEKGKELIDIIRTRILKEMWEARWDEVEMIKGFLAKPLIEDYNGKKIYYIEWLPIPFVGKIGFAYTFIDDFFMIGLNRPTIKKIIDTAATWDTAKKKLLKTTPFPPWTFFVTLFDWVTTSEKLRPLFEKNKSSIPRYTRYLSMFGGGGDTGIQSLMGSYYVTQDRNKRLWTPVAPFSYTFWSIGFTGNGEDIRVKVDQGKLLSLSWTTLQMWDNIKSDSGFPEEILSDAWISLESFLALSNIADYIGLNLIIQLDNAFEGDESLLRNATFWLVLWDDEIGFNVRIFREVWKSTSWSSLSQEMIMYLAIGWIIILICGIGGTIIYRRRKHSPLDDNTGMNQFGGNTPATQTVNTPTPVSSPLVVAPAASLLVSPTPTSDTIPDWDSLIVPPSDPELPDTPLVPPAPPTDIPAVTSLPLDNTNAATDILVPSTPPPITVEISPETTITTSSEN